MMNAFKEGVLFAVPDVPGGASRNNIISYRTWSVSPNPNGLTAESGADHWDFKYLHLAIFAMELRVIFRLLHSDFLSQTG